LWSWWREGKLEEIERMLSVVKQKGFKVYPVTTISLYWKNLKLEAGRLIIFTQ
jgi:acetolactate synthase regulatory subunit